jgi:hemoglobin-like flavoprotein
MTEPTHSLPAPETPETERALRRSFAAAMRDPERFGNEFYERAFALAPSIRPLFPADLTHQREKLVRALGVVVQGLDAPEALIPSLRQLGARHVGYGVHAGHYIIVGEALIDTLTSLTDPPMDSATRRAWTRLYGWIAATMLAGTDSASAVPRPATAALVSAAPAP